MRGNVPGQVDDEFEYDVFISYSSQDKDWVRGELLVFLEENGLQVVIDFRDFKPGAPSLVEKERAVLTSRKTILVLTPNYLASEWTNFESMMLQASDPTFRQRRLIPLLLEKADLPARIEMLTYLDFTKPTNRERSWANLLKALGQPLQKKVKPNRNRKAKGTSTRKPPEWEPASDGGIQDLGDQVIVDSVPLGKRQQETPENQTTVKTPDPFQYDVFLAFNSRDKQFARKLDADLIKQGLRVWFDDRELVPGTEFEKKILAGVEASRVVAVVITPNSSGSVWLPRIYRHALEIFDGTFPIIIPIRLQGADLPEELAGRIWVDFSDPKQYSQKVKELIRGIVGNESAPPQPTEIDEAQEELINNLAQTFSKARWLFSDLTTVLPVLQNLVAESQFAKNQEEREALLIREMTKLRPYQKLLLAIGLATNNRPLRNDFLGSVDNVAPRLAVTRAIDLVDSIEDLERLQQVIGKLVGYPPDMIAGVWFIVRGGKPPESLLQLPSEEQLPQPFKSQTPLPKPETERFDQLDVHARGLSDSKSKKDLLGFEDYAQALADFIVAEKTEKPLTIAIDAAWGMGKTTLMDFLKTRLESSPAKPLTVWFDAWTYAQEESLWAAMVLEILEQIRKRFTRQERIQLWWSLNLRRFDKVMFAASLLKSAGFVAGAFMLGVIATGIASLLNGSVWTLGFKELGDYVRFLGGISLAAFTPVLYWLTKDFLNGVAGPFDLKVGQYIREPDYNKRVGFLAEFKKDYEWVVASVARDQTRPLVVFIDDLDRCAPPKPAEIIEAINLLLDAKNSVFVIGMDSKMVAASLEVKYKDLTAYIGDADDPGGLTLGQRFLEKIIQVNFHIPHTDPDRVAKFVDVSIGIAESLPTPEPTRAAVQKEEQKIESGQTPNPKTSSEEKAVERAKQEIVVRTFEQSVHIRSALRLAVEYLGDNPRKIKRFINNYRLQVLIANRRGLITNRVIDLNLLAKWLVISTRWPDVARILPANNPFAEYLKNARSLQDGALLDEQAKAKLDWFLAQPFVRRSLGSIELLRLLDSMSAIDINALPTYQHLAQITQSHAETVSVTTPSSVPNSSNGNNATRT